MTLVPFSVFGQKYKRIASPTDTFFALDTIDLHDIPTVLPNGKWKVFFNNDTAKLHYSFNLVDNKVSGCFLEYNVYGNFLTIGTYKDDSLWTFRTGAYRKNSDTTFKVGNWIYYQWWGPTWDYVTASPESYKMPFDKDSLFYENWFYSTGIKRKQSIYHQRRGLIRETIYYHDGTVGQTFEQAKSSSLRTHWTKEQDVSSIHFTKDFAYDINFDTTQSYYSFCGDCTIQTTSDIRGNIISTTITNRQGKLMRFVGGGVTLDYNEFGKVKSIEYWNKNDKWKMKRLK